MQAGTIKDPTTNRNTVKRKQRDANEVGVRELEIAVEETGNHICVVCDRTFFSAETLEAHVDGSH